MRILKSLIFVIIAIAATVAGASGQSEVRAPKTWEVSKYDISVTLPAAETDRFVTSRALLSLRNISNAVASSLSLRISPSAEVSSVKVGGSAVDFSKVEEKVGSGSLQRIVVRALSSAPGSSLSVEVQYKLKVDENSGLASVTPQYAQFLPMSFWYPTPNSWFFPRGADFAPFRIQVNSPNAVSAGKFDGAVHDQQFLGQPFFTSAPFDQISSRNVNVFLTKGSSVQERQRAEDVAGVVADGREYFERLFGTTPDVPLKVVSVRRGGGFSDAGTILLDENVFRRQKLDSLTAMTIAESVARVWIGTTVAINGEGGGPLREGLVRFVATEFIEQKFGKDIADLERMRQRTAYSAVSKRDAPLSQITPLDDYYFVTNANKGAMAWRLLLRRVGADAFWGVLKANIKTGGLDLSGLRGAFGQHKGLLDYLLDQVTDMDLMIGLPQPGAGESRLALRNTGGIDAQVDVEAITESGIRLRNTVTVPAKGFAETVFRTNQKIVRAEVDSDKLYPQLDYSNDIKPLTVDESDGLLFVKRVFDRQDFAGAERNAQLVLTNSPRFDDVRVLLARSILAGGRTADAEREFRAALDEKLPSARTLAWANVGLGEIALRNNQPTQAAQFFESALRAGGEVGASLAARQGRLKSNTGLIVDDAIKNYFQLFDKAAVSANKAALEALMIPGETPKAFAGGIAGQAQEWASRVNQVELIDPLNVSVEVSLAIRIINKSAESGTAVFRLTKTATGWKLSGVESFEVR